MNWPTNSLPYGYGGRTAETIVCPVRIIMLPTSSSTDLVGRNARSATARINGGLFLPGAVRAAQAAAQAYAGRKAYANAGP